MHWILAQTMLGVVTVAVQCILAQTMLLGAGGGVRWKLAQTMMLVVVEGCGAVESCPNYDAGGWLLRRGGCSPRRDRFTVRSPKGSNFQPM